MPKYTNNDIKKAIKNSRSIRQVLQKIGLKEAGGNYFTIKRRIKKFGFNTNHFLGQGWCKNPPRTEYALKDILIKNSPYINTHNLKKKLIRKGIKKYQCERCLRTKWEGNKIPIELNHKNGDRRDNRIENLEILCPNCHALTPTYRGKNVKTLVIQRQR